MTRLGKKFRPIGVIVFKYSENPAQYYVAILLGRSIDGIASIRRSLQRPPSVDVNTIKQQAKRTAKRLAIPYVVGCTIIEKTIVLVTTVGKKVKNVVCK